MEHLNEEEKIARHNLMYGGTPPMNYLKPTPRPLTELEKYLLSDYTPTTRNTIKALYNPGRLPEDGVFPVKNRWFVELLHGDRLTFDTALPQMWLDHWTFTNYRLIAPGADSSIHDAYSYVLAGTVWAYPVGDGRWGVPFPLTRQAYELIKERYPE